MGAKMISSFELLHRAEFESRQGPVGEASAVALRSGICCVLSIKVGQLGQEFSSGRHWVSINLAVPRSNEIS